MLDHQEMECSNHLLLNHPQNPKTPFCDSLVCLLNYILTAMQIYYKPLKGFDNRSFDMRDNLAFASKQIDVRLGSPYRSTSNEEAVA